jgi:hypothetical protein
VMDVFPVLRGSLGGACRFAETLVETVDADRPTTASSGGRFTCSLQQFSRGA